MLDNRIIYSDNGTLADLSVKLNSFYSGSESLTWTAAEDALYIGSQLPFNHRYFSVPTPNAFASQVQVEIWDGSSWVSAVDILDYTENVDGTQTLTQDGIVSWSLAKGESWAKEDTETMTGSGLESLKIYGLYWLKITFTADLSFALDFIGWKFAEDEDLGGMYPDLNTSDVKDQFEVGKTSWEEQHLEAAKIIIRDLKNKFKYEGLINGDQILRWDLMREPGVHKLAEIIFNSHGVDGASNRDQARKYYKEALNQVNIQFDKNRNARVDEFEAVPNFNVIRR